MKKLAIAVFVGLLWASPAWAVTKVQAGCVTQNGASSSATVACTLGGGVAAGSLVPLFVARHTGVTSISGVTDDKSDTCTVGSDITGSTVIFTPVYCPNVTAGAKTFTATLSSAATLATIIVDGEYSGLLTSSPQDQTTGQAQTTPGTGSNAVTSGNVTPTSGVQGELVVAATINQTGAAGVGTITAGTGFTANQTVTNLLRSEFLIRNATSGTQAGTFTAGSASDSFNTAVMTFFPILGAAQLQAYAILSGTGVNTSQLQAYAILTPALNTSQLQAYAILCNTPGVGACPASVRGGAGASMQGEPF